MSKKITFKSDRFKKNRGGYSRWLLLSCAECKNPVSFYQKDCPGILKRLYLDRLVALGEFKDKYLICKKCKIILGIKMIYKKEGRSAYRLFSGAIGKKIVKGSDVAKSNF